MLQLMIAPPLTGASMHFHYTAGVPVNLESDDAVFFAIALHSASRLL